MEYCNQIVVNLERKIYSINSQSKSIFEEIEAGVYCCKTSLNLLRDQLLSKKYLSKEEECLFFKKIKPIAIGYIIYFLSLADFETKRPQNSKEKVIRHIKDYIDHYQSYYLEHRSFYHYLERKRTDRDLEYFLRSKGPVQFHPDALPYCMDANFSTSHDYIVAKIFAHKLLIKRLIKELDTLENPQSLPIPTFTSELQWTGNKVDLIELIYALHETGTINNGNTDIKVLAKVFQEILNIDLGEYYRTFIEIRSRKLAPTKFIDQMKSCLYRRMSQADE